MKGWILLPSKNGMNFFKFEVSKDGDLILYYDDRESYPHIYIDNLGEIICEYDTWYPNITIDNTDDIMYYYDNESDKRNIFLDEDGNIVMEVQEESIEFSKMFKLNSNGDLIYTFDDDPLNLYIDDKRNILLTIN